MRRYAPRYAHLGVPGVPRAGTRILLFFILYYRPLTQKNKGSAGPSFEEAKITSAALGPEERAEFDADPGKLSWTSAVPPGT